MKFIRKAYEFVIFIQFILFCIFVIENISNLNNIEYSVVILGTTYDFTINLYSIIAIIVVFFGILFLLSLNILDSGFNEEGTKNAGRFLSFLAIITILLVINSYYILQFGTTGLIVEFIFLLIYLFYALDRPNQMEADFE